MTKSAQLLVVRALQDCPSSTAQEIAEYLDLNASEVSAYIATLDPGRLGREVQKLYGFKRR